MILRFMGIGFFLSMIVLGYGWGRVLLPQLLARTVLVFLGTVVCLAAARKSVDLFVSVPPTAPSADPDVDLQEQQPSTGDPGMDSTAGESDGETGGSQDPSAGESTGEETVPDSPEESTSQDLEDDAEVEELAEMVSQTMAEDEGSG